MNVPLQPPSTPSPDFSQDGPGLPNPASHGEHPDQVTGTAFTASLKPPIYDCSPSPITLLKDCLWQVVGLKQSWFMFIVLAHCRAPSQEHLRFQESVKCYCPYTRYREYQ